MARRPDPTKMIAANVEACPELDVLLRIARFAGSDGYCPKSWPSPLCHASSWESNFSLDLAAKVERWMLSEAQQALVKKIAGQLAERAARKAAEAEAAKPIPAGRGVVSGVVLSLKSQSFYYHRHEQVTLKMLVGCDGYKLWGTVPAAIADKVQKGDEVRFVAIVTEKERGFGLFSRPSNAECFAAVAG